MDGLGGAYQQAKNKVSLKIVAENHYQHHRNHILNEEVTITLFGGQPKTPGIIRAQVVDKETGDPIKKFTVGKRYSAVAQKFTTTDGRFEDLSVHADRKYQRFLYVPGYAPEIVTIQSKAKNNKAETTINLSKSPPVRGQVVDANTGKPLPGVKIVCAEAGRYFPWDAFDTLHDGLHPMKMVQRGTTDAEGRFEFAEGQTKNHLYFYPKSGHIRFILGPINRQHDAGTDRLRVELPKAASVSGIYMRDGKPLANSQVRICNYQRTKPEENWEAVVTDKRGRFRFENLAMGVYSISGYVGRKFDLQQGQQLKLNLGDGLGPHTLKGKAIPFSRIHLNETIPDWDYTQLNTTADADGNYRIHGLKNGKYGVMLMHAPSATGFFLRSSTSIQIKGDTTQDFDRRGAVKKATPSDP